MIISRLIEDSHEWSAWLEKTAATGIAKPKICRSAGAHSLANSVFAVPPRRIAPANKPIALAAGGAGDRSTTYG
ncbi:hypothetical protein ACFRAR_08210 [Kitasatospora sp. NPDC056651]|uniref:hypothetical protein n=1 Tax=Kitasatospora sp. NPDC056651 TaxID=3345892 RepID=UPI0036CC9651